MSDRFKDRTRLDVGNVRPGCRATRQGHVREEAETHVQRHRGSRERRKRQGPGSHARNLIQPVNEACQVDSHGRQDMQSPPFFFVLFMALR